MGQMVRVTDALWWRLSGDDRRGAGADMLIPRMEAMVAAGCA